MERKRYFGAEKIEAEAKAREWADKNGYVILLLTCDFHKLADGGDFIFLLLCHFLFLLCIGSFLIPRIFTRQDYLPASFE
jgi:hypothetical protein